jgi:hypothetical protein
MTSVEFVNLFFAGMLAGDELVICCRTLCVPLWFYYDSRSFFGVRVTTPLPRTSRSCYCLS